MKTTLLPNGATGIVLTHDEVAAYTAFLNAPEMTGVTLNRHQVQVASQQAPCLASALTETLELNGQIGCVLLSEEAHAHEAVHECVHFGQIALSGTENDSTLLIDPSQIPTYCENQWAASLALVELVEIFRPYFEGTTPLKGYLFTARELLTELVAHILSGDCLMAHVRGWATPQEYNGECSLVKTYRKVIQQSHFQQWHDGGFGIGFLTDLFDKFEAGKIHPTHCDIHD